MITRQHCQELLSRAYIHALAASAGVNFSMGHAHDYGIDGQFKPVVARGHRLIESGAHLDFQLKASTDWQQVEHDIVYDLEAKNYNDIVDREPGATGFVLILLCLPSEESDWAAFTEDSLVLQRSCYWMRLEGALTDNVATKRIFIPRANLLTADSLKAVLEIERLRRLGHDDE